MADTYGVELLHPRREGRTPHQLGAKGSSNMRWIVGAKLAFVLTDGAWYGKTDDPPNMKVCPSGTWNMRMLIETVLSMLTTVCHLKKVAHRAADYFRMRRAFITTAFNLLIQWDGLQPDEHGFVKLSIAEFSL